MSAIYLQWELKRHGIIEYPVPLSDCILVTCQSTEAEPFVKNLRRKYPQKIIICGGSASTSPYTIAKYCNAVCVGDGQHFLSVLFSDGFEGAKKLPNVWIDGETRQVDIDFGFPWDMPAIQAEDGAFRVWAGRGCKKKCAFCQTGWAYQYSENPDPHKLIKTTKNILRQGERVAYLSNDLLQHSFASDLPPTMHGSYSIDFLQRTNILPPARQIRIGVEGVSERLRRYVSKPIRSDDLVSYTIWLNKNKKAVRWFMIAGIPGETPDDWEELKKTIQTWKRNTKIGVLELSFTAFTPDPATPLSIEPLTDDYWDCFKSFSDWFFDGVGWSNRIKLYKPQMPENRLKKAIRSMGITEDQLRQGGILSPNYERINYPYKANLNNKIQNRIKEIHQQNQTQLSQPAI